MLLLYVEDTAKGLVSYSSFFYYRFSSLSWSKKAEINLSYSLNFD
jgi:hypothetical protein